MRLRRGETYSQRRGRTRGQGLARAVFTLGFCMCLSSAFVSRAAARDIRNLTEKYESYERDLDNHLQALLASHSSVLKPAGEAVQSLEWLIKAHDERDHQGVLIMGEELFSRSSSLSHQDLVLASMTLSSSLYKLGEIRAAAEMCLSYAPIFEQWKHSDQVRRLAAMCSYATLKTLLLWGQGQGDGGQRFLNLSSSVGGETFSGHPAQVMSTLAGLLLDLRSGARNAPELARKIERSYREAFSGSSLPPKGAVGVAWVIAAVLGGHLPLAQEILSAGLGSGVHGGIASWLHGRVAFDMGRLGFAVARFEDSSEELLELLRQSTHQASPDEVAVALASRLVLDGARMVDRAGFPRRAMVMLGQARSSLASLSATNKGLSWLTRLSDNLELERARLIARTGVLPTDAAISAMTDLHKTALDRLAELRQALEEPDAGESPVASLAVVAQALGTRSRAVDAFVVGRKRLLGLEALEEALEVDKERLAWLEGEQPRAFASLVVWADVASHHFGSFARDLKGKLEAVHREMNAAGKAQSTLELISRLYGEAISGTEIAARQKQAFEEALDPLGAHAPSLASGLVPESEAEVLLAHEKLQNANLRMAQAMGPGARLSGQIDRSERVLKALAAETRAVLLTGLVQFGPGRKNALEERATLALEGMRRSLRAMTRIAGAYKRLLARRSEIRAEWTRQLNEAKSARERAVSHLNEMASQDAGVLAAEIRAHISSREAAVRESLLHARAAGAMGQEEMQEKLSELGNYLDEAKFALDAALAKGELR